jgi:hypothetical protein
VDPPEASGFFLCGAGHTIAGVTRHRAADPRRQLASAVHAARQMIARGDRPMYTIRATADGPFLFLEVLELPGVFSQASDRQEIDRMARDRIALELNVDPDAFDVRVEAKR